MKRVNDIASAAIAIVLAVIIMWGFMTGVRLLVPLLARLL